MEHQIKPWVIMTLIFFLGIVTGGALMLALGPLFKHPPGMEQLKNHWMMSMTHRLSLTPDQQAKINPIVADATNQIQAVRREDVGHISQIMEKANGQIAAILTPEQQVELQQMEKEMEKDRDRMFPGHMHSHGPGGPAMMHEGPPGGGMQSFSPQGNPPPSEMQSNAPSGGTPSPAPAASSE